MRKNVLATYVQHKTASNRHKRQYIVKLFNFLNFKMMTSCCVASCTIVQLTTQQLVLISTLKDNKLPFYLQDTSNKIPIGARREWLKAINRSDWDT